MSDNHRASDIIKKAKEDFDSGKISRRDFNSILMTFGAIAEAPQKYATAR